MYKTVILPVVLYACEIWSLTLEEECRLREFENRILSRIFGPKRDENRKWRRLHNVELHSLYRSPNIVRVIKSTSLRWVGHVDRMEEGRSAFKILTVAPTGKRPLRRPRRRWEENIRMDLKEIGIHTGNRVDSAQDSYYWRALVNAAFNLWASQDIKAIRKRVSGRPRRRWEDYIGTDLKEWVPIRRIKSIRLIIQRLLESPCECGIQPLGFTRH